MSLSGEVLGDMIEKNLQRYGNGGVNRKKFCLAIATGIVKTIVGKTFVTQDVGTIPGAGQGRGTGIQKLMYDNMTNLALAQMETKGENAKPLMESIMKATVDHLKQSAQLTSVHAPVFLGTGTLMHISTVLIPEMTTNIYSQLNGKGATGRNRLPLSKAIATGVCTDILQNSTGTVIIVGSPAGIPVGGAGVGTGVIS